jgi:AcrR family transcriptional regulator
MDQAEKLDGLRERKKQQTRERLMAAAFRLLKERGYQGATVELMAEEAEVSVTTFFRYFESKEDVFLASHLAIIERVETAIRDRAPDVSVFDALRVVVDDVLREMPEDISDEKVHKEIDAIPELRERTRAHEARIGNALMEAFGEQLGVPPTDLEPRVLGSAVLSAFDAAWAAWVVDPRDMSLRAYMADALDLVERMILPMLDREPAHRKSDS